MRGKNNINKICCFLIFILFQIYSSLVLSNEPMRKIGFKLSDDGMHVAFGYRDLFTPEVTRKLYSGLPSRFRVTIAIENQQNKEAIVYSRNIQIVYDIWEEYFLVSIEEQNKKSVHKFENLKELKNFTGVLRWAKIIDEIPENTFRFRVLIEANPVSKRTIRNIRRWVSRSQSSASSNRRTTSYFGSFVGHFVDDSIGEADKIILFVSQWFVR